MASRTGKILSANIIAPGAECTRLQDMCNARAYSRSQSIGRILNSQPAPVQDARVNHLTRSANNHPDVVAQTFEESLG